MVTITSQLLLRDMLTSTGKITVMTCTVKSTSMSAMSFTSQLYPVCLSATSVLFILWITLTSLSATEIRTGEDTKRTRL